MLTPDDAPLDEGDSETITAILRIDPEPSGKRLQAVWLEPRGGGEPRVIAYRPTPCWRAVEGQVVRATGAVYEPLGQSIGAIHFRVERLELAEPTPHVGVAVIGAEHTVTGTLALRSPPQGAKGRGESYTVLEGEDGTEWMLLNRAAVPAEAGQRVTVTGRSVELSPYIAHIAGPRLCVTRASVLGAAGGGSPGG